MSHIPPAREAALRKLGAQIGLHPTEPTVAVKGFRISEGDHRLWMELAHVHGLNASKTLGVMIDAYLEAHQEDFRPWSGTGAALPVRFGCFTMLKRQNDLLRDRCKTHQVSTSDCIRQIINWTAGLID
jgi:hypothetical protein